MILFPIPDYRQFFHDNWSRRCRCCCWLDFPLHMPQVSCSELDFKWCPHLLNAARVSEKCHFYNWRKKSKVLATADSLQGNWKECNIYFNKWMQIRNSPRNCKDARWSVEIKPSSASSPQYDYNFEPSFTMSVACLRFANLFCNHYSFEYPNSTVHSENVCIFESTSEPSFFVLC